MYAKIISVLSMVAFVVLAFCVFFFFQWIQSHVYTLIWLLCVVGCIVWLVMSVLPRPFEYDEQNFKFPDKEFKG